MWLLHFWKPELEEVLGVGGGDRECELEDRSLMGSKEDYRGSFIGQRSKDVIAVQKKRKYDAVRLPEAADLLFHDLDGAGTRGAIERNIALFWTVWQYHDATRPLPQDMSRQQAAEVEQRVETGRAHEIFEVDNEEKSWIRDRLDLRNI